MSMDKSDIARVVSRETIERLNVYVELLKRWNPKINLVSPATIQDVWARHIGDSLQIADLDTSNSRWADIGSGAGFPGLVVACQSPERDVVLVESDRRKCLFMQTVIRECRLAARVVNSRIENLDTVGASVLSARALAPLPNLLDFASQHLEHDGVCLFLKGANRQSEILEARRYWTFELDEVQSQTNENSAILRIRGLKRV